MGLHSGWLLLTDASGRLVADGLHSQPVRAQEHRNVRDVRAASSIGDSAWPWVWAVRRPRSWTGIAGIRSRLPDETWAARAEPTINYT